jgi:hypothetical protein
MPTSRIRFIKKSSRRNGAKGKLFQKYNPWIVFHFPGHPFHGHFIQNILEWFYGHVSQHTRMAKIHYLPPFYLGRSDPIVRAGQS